VSKRMIGLAVAVAAAAAVLLLPGTAAAQSDVSAKGTAWDPGQVDVALNDSVTWHFDDPENFLPHDVWLVPPGGDPDPAGPDIFEVTDGPVQPDGPPVSHTFAELGTWTYICRIHSGFSGGEWIGMVGTADVSNAPPTDTELGLGVTPQTKRVRPSQQATFTARVENVGAAPGTNVRVCAQAPTRLVAITSKPCQTYASLGIGASRAPRFTIKPKRRARGKSVRISFTATAANAPRETATAILRVRRR
jgi:plastocyanin